MKDKIQNKLNRKIYNVEETYGIVNKKFPFVYMQNNTHDTDIFFSSKISVKESHNLTRKTLGALCILG